MMKGLLFMANSIWGEGPSVEVLVGLSCHLLGGYLMTGPWENLPN